MRQLGFLDTLKGPMAFLSKYASLLAGLESEGGGRELGTRPVIVALRSKQQEKPRTMDHGGAEGSGRVLVVDKGKVIHEQYGR